jgi:uncharacterized protein with PIN domain
MRKGCKLVRSTGIGPHLVSRHMSTCHHCGKRLVRVHRKQFEKFIWSDMYECVGCKRRAGVNHRALYVNGHFLFSRYSRCIRCGSEAVQRLKKRDKVDEFSKNPLALVQAILGAPVNRCSPCRLQFFDWRKPRPGVT